MSTTDEDTDAILKHVQSEVLKVLREEFEELIKKIVEENTELKNKLRTLVGESDATKPFSIEKTMGHILKP